jgi:hypothetical protein
LLDSCWIQTCLTRQECFRYSLGGFRVESYIQNLRLWPLVQFATQSRREFDKPCKFSGLAELMVFYCEQTAGFCSDIGLEDESYFAALVRMFEQALTIADTLPARSRDALITRLGRVHGISQKLGYGVGDDTDFLLAKYMKRRD